MNLEKLAKAVSVFGLVIAVLMVGIYFYLRSNPQQASTRPSTPSKTVISEQDFNKSIPEGLFVDPNPKDDGESFFSQRSFNGYDNKSVVYTSSQSFEKTNQFFQNYLTKNNWSKLDESGYGATTTKSYYYYQKENNRLIILVEKTPLDTVEVKITFETKKI